MSTNPQPSPYPRENYFAHDEANDDDPAYEEVTVQTEQQNNYGVSKEAWFSKTILLSYGDPTLLCPRCFHVFDRQSELSEPTDHIKPSDYIEVDASNPGEDERRWIPFSDQDETLTDYEDDEVRHRDAYSDHRQHRHCNDSGCSHYSWGGLLQDRPTDEYLDIVEITLDEIYGVVTKREEYFSNAQSRKAKGKNDVENHRRLIQELEAGDPDI